MNKNKIQVIDTFLFYNELELLKVRLDYLEPAVDFFLIVEANIDFSGKPKIFALDEVNIKNLPHSHKIIYEKVFIDLYSPYWIFMKLKYFGRKSRYLWKIQDYQRNAILKPLKKFSKDCRILFGDLDEIPKLNIVSKLKNKKIQDTATLEQKLFYYNLYNYVGPGNWYGTIVTTNKALSQTKPSKIRSLREHLPKIKKGGWHLSYFFPPKIILEKINSIADVEKINKGNLTINTITSSVKNSQDIYGRNISIKKIDSPEKFFDEKFLNSFKLFFQNSDLPNIES